MKRGGATWHNDGGELGILIRPERRDDDRAVALVHTKAWQVGYSRILSDAVLAGLDVAEWTARRRRFFEDLKPGVRTLLAEANGKVLGFVTFGPGESEPEVGRVCACYMDPDEWGTGSATG